MSQVYLKSNIKSEPLIWKWYAWVHLVSPLTAGCNLKNRYIPILESFVKKPELHVEAQSMPEMVGSPFVNLPIEAVHDVETILDMLKTESQPLIDLATDYLDFERSLHETYTGQSLEQAYQLMPDSLKGCVELIYDSYNQPKIRIIEKLLYNKYYNTISQESYLTSMSSDDRPFALSTPYIPQEEAISVNLPFSSKAYDHLFESQFRPSSLSTLMDILEVPSDDMRNFASLFTENTPEKKDDRHFNVDGVRVRYFGHACVLLQTKEISILIDPFISYNYTTNLQRYTYDDLPDTIDYVLISHAHQDHIQLETLHKLRHKIKKIIVPQNLAGSILDPCLKLILEQFGFNEIITMGEFDSIHLANGEILSVPFFGEHGDLEIMSKLSYVVRLNKTRFLFATDSNNLSPELYINIKNAVGKINVAYIGMECHGAPLSWLYAPLFSKPLARKFDQERRLSGSNFEKVRMILKDLDVEDVFIYAMGMEAWLSYIMGLAYTDASEPIIESNKLIEYCKSVNLNCERLYISNEKIFE